MKKTADEQIPNNRGFRRMDARTNKHEFEEPFRQKPVAQRMLLKLKSYHFKHCRNPIRRHRIRQSNLSCL